MTAAINLGEEKPGKRAGMPLSWLNHARFDVETPGRRGAAGRGEKKARCGGAAVFYPGRAGGASLGSFAGLFSHQRRVVARHRRAAASRAALFAESLLVTVGTPLR